MIDFKAECEARGLKMVDVKLASIDAQDLYIKVTTKDGNNDGNGYGYGYENKKLTEYEVKEI